jgi:hypothetical protein
MARPLSPTEKAQAKRIWPRLNVSNVVVTGEATQQYNCLAWTLGITNRWVWPWGSRNATKAEFDALYRGFGFASSGTGPLAAFGLNLNSMTHGSISGPGHGPRWESKCGAWLRIQHGLGELEGGSLYGNVCGFYNKRGVVVAATAVSKMAPMNKLSKIEVEALKRKFDAVPRELRSAFNKAYAEWRESWDHPLIVVSSDPTTRTHSTAFIELVALGPQILPLLIEKLTKPDEFFALQAVDRLLRPEAIVTVDVEDPAALEGEQARALETIRRWLALET